MAIRITWEYHGPDISSRGMNRKLKKAVDTALLAYRRQFMIRHFQRTAVGRYGGEYRKLASSAKKVSARNWYKSLSPEELAKYRATKTGNRRLDRYFGMMTPEQRQRFQGMSKNAQRRMVERVMTRQIKPVAPGNSQDPKGDIPLVESGMMRRNAVAGPVSFHLPVGRRRMDIHGLPAYLRQKGKGTIDKVEALQSNTPDEQVRFARVADAKLHDLLSKREMTLHGKRR